VDEAARDVARAIANTRTYEQTRRDRKKVEMRSSTSSASCVLTAFDCEDRPARNSSLPVQQSPRIVSSPSRRSDHQMRAHNASRK